MKHMAIRDINWLRNELFHDDSSERIRDGGKIKQKMNLFRKYIKKDYPTTDKEWGKLQIEVMRATILYMEALLEKIKA